MVIAVLNFLHDFKINSIIEYEAEEDISLFNELGSCESYVVADLIKISLGCNDNDANTLLEKALENYDIEDICKYCAEKLVGKASDSDEKLDLDKFKNYSDILEYFFNELQGIDELPLDTFLQMSTRYLYKYSEGVKKRYINRKNTETQSQYSLVVMMGSLLAGKLKECPQYDENGNLKKKSVIEQIAELKALSNKHRGDE